MPSKGQQDLDQYIFSRPEMAKLLGISTNALRCRMRKGKCDLEYRFDGKKFLFKRPRDIKVHEPPLDHPKNSHEKTLRDYDRRVQQRYNRGSTHREHGGEPPYKGKYDQQSSGFGLESLIKGALGIAAGYYLGQAIGGSSGTSGQTSQGNTTILRGYRCTLHPTAFDC